MATLSIPLPYQEGTWTPVFTFATPGNLSVAYTTQSGTYTRVGRLVVASFVILTSTYTQTTASGNAQVTGLPFTSAGGLSVFGPSFWQGITKANYTNVMARLVTASSTIDFGIAGSGQTATVVQASDMPSGGTISLTGTLSFTV